MSSDAGDQAELRGYIESSPDAIVIADPGTREIVETNRAAEDFFGYPQERLRSMEILDLHPSDETQRYAQLFEEHFENQPAAISQFEDGSPVFATTADGERIPVEINAWRIDIDSDEAPLFQGVFRDISEQLQRRRELQRQKERLDEFAGLISHDLRAPLTVAQERARLVQQDHESEHVDSLQASLDRVETIIEDTLVLARNGERVGEKRPVDIGEAVAEYWDVIDTAEATMDIADEFTIRADPGRLQHIFENLIRNAVNHGGADVTVRVGRADEDTMYFEDDAGGIAEDERDAVFEHGYSKASDGTGFGLTIVHRLAESHGWTVTLAESDAGGARFEFGDVDIE